MTLKSAMLGTIIVVLFGICAVAVADLHLNDDQIKNLITRLKTELSRQNIDNIQEDASLKVPGLVRKYGYPLEEHHVTTSDGYILGLHRIPHGRDHHINSTIVKPVVFIMHGLESSSADFILMGPDKGLAYILADEGFDVWLGNARGNRYSRRHVILNPDTKFNPAFWQFSWDEIGNIDLPAMIDHALKTSKKEKLHYIGHSQGTTTFFVMCSMRAEYNQKIISMNALSPVAYLTHGFCPLVRAFSRFSRFISKLANLVGQGEIFPNYLIMKWAGQKLCRDQAITQEVCSSIAFLIGGWNSIEFNRTMLPVIMSHSPAGASIRQFAHYGQVMYAQEFQRFDHGWWKNPKVYGTLKAPLYDLSKVKAPVFLHYSLADPLVHVKDVKRLWSELGNLKAKYIVPMSSFSHFDFVWGIDSRALVYDQVIADMRKAQDAYVKRVPGVY